MCEVCNVVCEECELRSVVCEECSVRGGAVCEVCNVVCEECELRCVVCACGVCVCYYYTRTPSTTLYTLSL